MSSSSKSEPTALSSSVASDAGQTNPRGIPVAPFVEKVEDFVASRAEVEPALKKFQEMIAKYQFMELNTQRRATSLRDKIPDIQKTLETVRFLRSRSSSSSKRFSDDGDDTKRSQPVLLQTHYELNDTLYAKANIKLPLDEVYLWLGANVMLAYPVDEAEELLKGKLSAAKESLENCEEDLDFLRQQITTLEVNTARIYNWDVTQKRKEKEKEGA